MCSYKNKVLKNCRFVNSGQMLQESGDTTAFLETPAKKRNVGNPYRISLSSQYFSIYSDDKEVESKFKDS